MQTVLLTGASGFTGCYLKEYLQQKGFSVIDCNVDLADKAALTEFIHAQSFHYVVHLGAISFVGDSDFEAFYKVNTLGTENLLLALKSLNKPLKKVILTSSANVYGDSQFCRDLSEDVCPQPVNHYACSKLAMEQIARNFYDDFPIIITRPFNYTGIGQAQYFLVPKIVSHFQKKASFIELGNTNVFRDFSSVEDIVECYWRLMLCEKTSITVNLCSQQATSLQSILDMMTDISGHQLTVKINPEFVRDKDIPFLQGNNTKLYECIGFTPNAEGFKQTLEKMYHHRD